MSAPDSRPRIAEALLARGVREPEPASARETSIVAALLLLAAALRLYDLGDGPWFDEIDTWVHYARRPLGEILTSFDSQNNHLLYSVLARISFVLFGESAWALRLPAALLGVASIFAVWRFALRVTDRREALLAAALLTVSYHHLWFSQNARGYTGLLLFTTCGSLAFVKLLARREHSGRGAFRLPLAYGAWMALAVATHATAAVVVAAHGLVWLALLWTRRSANVRANRWLPGVALALAGVFSLLAYSLVLDQFVGTLTAPTMVHRAVEWKSPVWLVTETLQGLSRGLPGGWLALGAAYAVGGLGLWSYARQSAAVLAVLLLPAVMTAAAIVALHHNLWPRFFFFGAGCFVLIALRGLSELVERLARGRLLASAPTLRWLAPVGVCLASAATLPRAWAPKQDFEGARRYVDAERAPEDAVVTLGMTVLPYRELYTADWEAVDTLPQLAAIEASHPRTWVVATTPTHLQAEFPEIWERLQGYASARTFPGTVAGSDVLVLVRR